MDERKTDHLRVLIANERKDRLALVAPIVVALGHEVIAREIDVEDLVVNYVSYCMGLWWKWSAGIDGDASGSSC